MLKRILLLIAFTLPLPAMAQMKWMEGRHYLVVPGGLTAETRPGKIEVAEVFSYGCIHCYRAQDNVAKLKAALPADAYMTYVHAAFMSAEAWPMFQRAWYTAQNLGIGEANHHRMFSAIWETGELPLVDKATNSIRRPPPTLEETARFYARAAKVKEADFLKAAASFDVNSKIARAEQLIKTWRVNSTPTLVVNGRYVINNDVVTSWADTQELVMVLIGLERRRMAAATRP